MRTATRKRGHGLAVIRQCLAEGVTNSATISQRMYETPAKDPDDSFKSPSEARGFYNWFLKPAQQRIYDIPATLQPNPVNRGVMGKKTTRDMILRRIDFLVREANSRDDMLYDNTVKEALYMINNVLAADGYYFSASSALIRNNPWRSREAHKQIAGGDWTKLTNEHQDPSVQVWDWIKKNTPGLIPDQVLARCEKWPVVTITEAEEKGLRGRNWVPAAERYLAVDVDGHVQDIMVGKYDKTRDVWTPRGY